MGDPATPDIDRLPATPWFVDERWTHVHGMELLDARYGLLVDNLLDLSHETFLHGDLIGTPEVAESPITTSIDEERAVVRVSRRMESAECPPSTRSDRVALTDRPMAGHRVPRTRVLPPPRPRRPRRIDAGR